MDYVGILIERNDGKILFELRDYNPYIKNRNCWSIFGGGIKLNEKPVDAAIRELKEELEISIKKNQLHLLMVIPGIKNKNYLYKLPLGKEKEHFTLKEGVAMGYFTPSEMRKKKNVVKTLRFLLYFY